MLTEFSPVHRDRSALRRFVECWTMQCDRMMQRAGFLFGYFELDENYPNGIKAVVQAIYEPAQQNFMDEVRITQDLYLKTVGSVSKCFGMKWLVKNIRCHAYIGLHS